MHASMPQRFQVALFAIMVGIILGAGTVQVAAAQAATPVGVMGEPTTDAPEPSPMATETIAPPPSGAASDEYAEILLLFTDTRPGAQTYPGQICATVSVSPPLYSGSWVGTMCESSSPETTTWRSDAYVSLPIASSYTVTVASNTTGCAATPQPGIVQEVDSGRTFGRLVVDIDCGGVAEPSPSTVTPDDTVTPDIGIEAPTRAPTVVPTAGEEYRSVTLRYVDRRTDPYLPFPLYPGDLCVQVSADPPPLDPRQFVSLCAHDPVWVTWRSSDIVRLPMTSTYTATILSNDTGCAVTIEPFVEVMVGGHRTGEIIASIDCSTPPLLPTPTPEPAAAYSLLMMHYQDVRGGGGSYAYPGDLCVELTGDPPLPGGTRLGPICERTSPSAAIWFPPDTEPLPVATTYRAVITRNDTGCAATVSPQIHGDVATTVTEPGGRVEGLVRVWIDCGGDTPTPTSTSATTPDPTIDPKSTATTPATTAPDPTISPTALPPTPHPSSTAPAGHGASTITGLPKTGVATPDAIRDDRLPTLILAGSALTLLAAGITLRRRPCHIQG